MADQEAKDVASTNEELVESAPQEVPDPNPIQNEETEISESNAADGTEISPTEEGQNEEPPAEIQETTSSAAMETADEIVLDAAVSATDEEAVQNAEDTEATEKSKADEVQEEASVNKLDELEFSLEQLLNIEHDDDDDDDDELFKEFEKELKMENEMSAQWEELEPTTSDEKKEGDRQKEETETEHEHKLQQKISRGLMLHSKLSREKEKEKGSDEDAAERTKLMEKYQKSIITRDQLQQQNAIVQQKLVKFFKMKKTDDSCTDAKNVADLEQRYLKLMAQIEELQVEQETENTAQSQRTNELELQYNEKKKRMESDQRKLQDMKKYVAQQAINSRSGKPIPEKDIEQYLANEEKKDTELDNVRLENIKLKNRLKKKELQRKSKEGLADGLRLIDFEQLKIENQTYNEKIEERIEELHKLDKKIKNTAEVQTHMTEKLQFIQVENEVLSKELQDIEAQVAQKRDELSRTKQMRDALKRNNSSLHKNCGLLGNRLLLRNFEDQKDENERLLKELENLKMTFAEYTMQAKQVQQKINQATQQIGFQQK